MTFKTLQLRPGILKAIEESGYKVPTPIQEKSIPIILNRLDLRASAQTGTGKTASFLLPILNQLTTPPESPVKRGPRVLILVPTRELAMQVTTEAVKYSKHLPKIKTICVYGGIPYPEQNRKLSKPYEILVATPGRLIDHLERGRIHLSKLEILVLDEADRMLDMGFIEPVEQIAKKAPKTVQTLLFSATLHKHVLKLSDRLLKNPKEINLTHNNTNHNKIKQNIYRVDDLNHKHQLLEHLLEDASINQAIVFTATKRYADTITTKLRKGSHHAAALHGDIKQRKRTQIIKQFRQGKIRILVATDVAARGIDIHAVSHVINFDLPNSVEDYIHRIGRTGRLADGTALSFAASKDTFLIRDIEKYIGAKIATLVVSGMEPKKKVSMRAKRSSSRNNRSPSRNNRPPKRNGRSQVRAKSWNKNKRARKR